MSKLGGGSIQDRLRQLNHGCSSFLAGTLVHTPQGHRRIESLRQGDQVHSRSDANWSEGAQKILATPHRQSQDYRELETEGESYRITGEHPVWVQGFGWKAAQELEEGDILSTRGGDTQVIGNRAVRAQEAHSVHNLSVANTPSYFVGEQGLWVHNARPCRFQDRPNAEKPMASANKPRETKPSSLDLNNPKPNRIYDIEKGRYIFETDEYGRTMTAQMNFDPNIHSARRADRDHGAQDSVRNEAGQPGDHAGHLISSNLGGAGERINLLPQNGKINQSKYRELEMKLEKAIREGKEVTMTVRPDYGPNNPDPAKINRRPIGYEVEYSIDGIPGEGKTFPN